MKAVTNSGQLQNKWSLFLWQNQGNFMLSVNSTIKLTGMITRNLKYQEFSVASLLIVSQ